MKKWFQKIGDKFQGWMQGRYGTDELSQFLNVITLILLIAACFPKISFLFIPALVIWIWVLIRSFSKNIEKRRKERAVYLRFTGRIKGWFSLRKRMWRERKTYSYCKCSQCKTRLRVPKGKGKIKITCPKCHAETIKKT